MALTLEEGEAGGRASSAGESGGDGLDFIVGYVVVILVGGEEKIGRGAEPEAVGVCEDDDAAVAIVREALAAGFVVTIFGDHETTAMIPAERHRRCDRGFGGGEYYLEAGGDAHLGDGFAAIGLGEAPAHAVGGFAGVGFPGIGEGNVVERAGTDGNLVADGFAFTLGERPVAGDRTAGIGAQLAVDSPRERGSRRFSGDRT